MTTRTKPWSWPVIKQEKFIPTKSMSHLIIFNGRGLRTNTYEKMRVEVFKALKGKKVILLGNIHKDSIYHDYESTIDFSLYDIIARCNHPWNWRGRKAHVCFINMINPLGFRVYPSFHILTGIMTARMILESEVKSLHIDGMDFYLNETPVGPKKWCVNGVHDMLKNVEVFKGLLEKHKDKVSLSEIVKGALEAYAR